MPLAQGSRAQKKFQIYAWAVDIRYLCNIIYDIYIYIYIYIYTYIHINIHVCVQYIYKIYIHIQSEAYLKSSRTFEVELFCRNSQSVKVVGYFRRRASSLIFDSIPNATLSNSKHLPRSFSPLGLHKGIVDFSFLLILLIYTNNKKN